MKKSIYFFLALSGMLSGELSAQNVGIGISAPQQKLHVGGNGVIRDSLGIGTTSPNAPLQFANTNGRKVVLYEDAANDHQYYGFGIGSSTIVYQTMQDHTFLVGSSSETSDELMRIKANGNIGIGISDPLQKLHVAGKGIIRDSLGIGTATPHAPLQFANGNGRKLILHENAVNDHRYYGFAIGPSMLRYQTVQDHVFLAGITDTTSRELLRIKASGNIGIGTSSPQQKLHVAGKAIIRDSIGIGVSSPHAPLQFANATGRKLVLYEDAINDHQYYGLAIDPSTLRFQSGSGFAFFVADSDSFSNELMRIAPTGNTGIGTDQLTEKLVVNGAVKIANGGYTGLVQNATTPVPAGGSGTIVFSNNHFFGWNGTQWKQLDN
jgi:hypothetical protein